MMYDPVPNRHAQSLHARIRAEIEARILSGEWPPGYRIPPETKLMQIWGCSRMTVNKAVAALAAQGLVERNRRAGTYVAQPRMQTAVLHIPDIRAETNAQGISYEYRLISDEYRPACCVYLGAEGPDLGESRFLKSIHLAGGSALLFEERHIFFDSVPEAETADFTVEPPGTWLLAHVPWTEAEHRICAVAADGAVAAALALEPGSPCLQLERRTWRSDKTVTIARQTFRGDGFDLTARFAPGGSPMKSGDV